jgi:hypothetical protein
MLGKALIKYVTSKDKSGYSREVQRVYNSRIKTDAKQAIKNLTALAEQLPQDQRVEIFNDKTLGPLISAIILPAPEEMQQLEVDKELAMKKRQNLLPICYTLISQLNDPNLAHLLAPVGIRYMVKEGGHLAFLKAIYYRSLNSDEEE